MKQIGKFLLMSIGFLFGIGMFSVGTIIIGLFYFLISIVIVSVPFYYLWNYIGTIEGFVFLPHITFLTSISLVIMLRLIHMAFVGIRFSNNKATEKAIATKNIEVDSTVKKEKNKLFNI
jgi:hypothetical protein